MKWQPFCLALLVWLVSPSGHGKQIETNWVHMAEAPDWLTRGRVEKVIARIQTLLEWDIRRAEVFWYGDSQSFAKAHSLGPLAMAVSKKGDNTIHLGPHVTKDNFDQTFGHELVHIVLGQKYKDAIPKWFEEGLANHLAKSGKVDYRWLASQPFPPDVRKLSHPYRESQASKVHYHYIASQALAEMIAKRCSLGQLLQLSVGEDMERYLPTYCEIRDLNAEFRAWVKKNAR